jgi:hypothetical protein
MFRENDDRSRPAGDEILTDYRQRLALEAHERAERKRLELADQHSSVNAPATRIRAWEKVHALRMPSDPQHPVLDVIAAATQLTLAEVQEEQRIRSGAKA